MTNHNPGVYEDSTSIDPHSLNEYLSGTTEEDLAFQEAKMAEVFDEDGRVKRTGGVTRENPLSAPERSHSPVEQAVNEPVNEGQRHDALSNQPDGVVPPAGPLGHDTDAHDGHVGTPNPADSPFGPAAHDAQSPDQLPLDDSAVHDGDTVEISKDPAGDASKRPLPGDATS